MPKDKKPNDKKDSKKVEKDNEKKLKLAKQKEEKKQAEKKKLDKKLQKKLEKKNKKIEAKQERNKTSNTELLDNDDLDYDFLINGTPSRGPIRIPPSSPCSSILSHSTIESRGLLSSPISSLRGRARGIIRGNNDLQSPLDTFNFNDRKVYSETTFRGRGRLPFILEPSSLPYKTTVDHHGRINLYKAFDSKDPKFHDDYDDDDELQSNKSPKSTCKKNFQDGLVESLQKLTVAEKADSSAWIKWPRSLKTLDELRRNFLTSTEPSQNMVEILDEANRVTRELSVRDSVRLETLFAQQQQQCRELRIRPESNDYAFYYSKELGMPVTEEDGLGFSDLLPCSVPYDQILTASVLFNEGRVISLDSDQVSRMNSAFEYAMQLYQSRRRTERNGWLVDDSSIGDENRLFFLPTPINIQKIKREFLKLFSGSSNGMGFDVSSGDSPAAKKIKMTSSGKYGDHDDDEPMDDGQMAGPSGSGSGRGSGDGDGRKGEEEDDQKMEQSKTTGDLDNIILSIADPFGVEPRERLHYLLGDEHIRQIIAPNSHYGIPFMHRILEQTREEEVPDMWSTDTINSELIMSGNEVFNDATIIWNRYEQRAIQLRRVVNRAQLSRDRNAIQRIHDVVAEERVKINAARMALRRQQANLFFYQPVSLGTHMRGDEVAGQRETLTADQESIIGFFYFCYREWMEFLDYICVRLDETERKLEERPDFHGNDYSVMGDTYLTPIGSAVTVDPHSLSLQERPYSESEVVKLRDMLTFALAHNLSAGLENAKRVEEFEIALLDYEEALRKNKIWLPKIPCLGYQIPEVPALRINRLRRKYEYALSRCNCTLETRRQLTISPTPLQDGRVPTNRDFNVPTGNLSLLRHQVEILNRTRIFGNEVRVPQVPSAVNVPFMGANRVRVTGDQLPQNWEEYFARESINRDLEAQTLYPVQRMLEQFSHRSSVIRGLVVSVYNRPITDDLNGIIRDPIAFDITRSDEAFQRHVNLPRPDRPDQSPHRLGELLEFERRAIHLTISIVRDTFPTCFFGRKVSTLTDGITNAQEEAICNFFFFLGEYLEFLQHMIALIAVKCAEVDAEQRRQRVSMQASLDRVNRALELRRRYED